MDWKSIVLNKRMKFFTDIILISNYLSLSWAYPCDVQDTPEPFHPLSYLYSKHHSQQTKSVYPNIACLTWGIHFVAFEMIDPLISLLKYLYSKKVETQHAYGYDPYLQLSSKYGHSQNYISGLIYHDSDVGHLLVKQHIDISLPKQYGNSNSLSNVNFYGNLTFNKTKTFIETKVTAIKLQGFNL